MCKQLSERAADDLIAFVRKVMRERSAIQLRVQQNSNNTPAAWPALEGLGESARATLTKHGLLTPADDPEVAAVFMEEEPGGAYVSRRKPNPPTPDPNYASCDVPGCNFLAESRFGYCCSPEHEAEMLRQREDPEYDPSDKCPGGGLRFPHESVRVSARRAAVHDARLSPPLTLLRDEGVTRCLL